LFADVVASVDNMLMPPLPLLSPDAAYAMPFTPYAAATTARCYADCYTIMSRCRRLRHAASARFSYAAR